MPGTAGPARTRTARPWRLLAAAATVAGSAAAGFAQTPGANEPPGGQRPYVPPLGATSPLPNIAVPQVPAPPPPVAASPVPPAAPKADPLLGPPAAPQPLNSPANDLLLPPSALEASDLFPPAPTAAAASATPVVPVVGPRKPLPGSLADQVERDYAARALFRYCTWKDLTITALPSTLLWEPPLAIFREPRMAASYSTLDNYRGPNTLDTSLGTTFGLFRFEPIGTDAKYQLDLFGVVQTRLSPDDVMAQSYRFGFPVTFARGPWSGKIGFEHTSDHLGDELIFHTGRTFTRYAKNEIVMALSRYFYNSLRVYGQYSYAGDQDLPQAYSRNRYDAGFEYYDRRPTGFNGTPFVAFNTTWRGELDHVPITTSQLGWIWRNPEARLSSFRLFGSYYAGGSPYGQFFQDRREHWWAISIAGDY